MGREDKMGIESIFNNIFNLVGLLYFHDIFTQQNLFFSFFFNFFVLLLIFLDLFIFPNIHIRIVSFCNFAGADVNLYADAPWKRIRILFIEYYIYCMYL